LDRKKKKKQFHTFGGATTVSGWARELTRVPGRKKIGQNKR
jgi:hypothetical protein